MRDLVSIVDRSPTTAEYLELIAAVGWRSRDPGAIEVALANSHYAVCAESGGVIIGCGRVIGDGGLHLYLTDVIVHPAHQRRGTGTAIVAALDHYVESVPYRNLLVAVLPTPGLVGFYGKHGYKSQGPETPIMQKWHNRIGE